jgi:hypothetical protein
VLASTEPRFDSEQDAIWELDLVDGRVDLRESPWRRYGDVNAWLTSSIFGLKTALSLEAEHARTEALKLFAGRDKPLTADVDRVDGLLRAALSDVDRFWVRWTEFKRSLESSR